MKTVLHGLRRGARETAQKPAEREEGGRNWPCAGIQGTPSRRERKE